MKNRQAHSQGRQLLKRCLDIVLVLVGGILAIPIFLWAYFRIKRESPGPFLHDGERMGQFGKPFKCYKIRSMYMNSEQVLEEYFQKHPVETENWRIYHKLDYDPRITPFGHFIRRTSIDELPQLWNILRGEMSVVGPRPYLENELEEMGKNAPIILSIKPGLTGYWQVHGRNDVPFKKRLAMDRLYVKNISLCCDFKLLLKTVPVVLGKRGAR